MWQGEINSEFFDRVFERRNSGIVRSVKYDLKPGKIKSDNLIPMWVADMDFKMPPEVESALKQTLEYGFLGYSDSGEDFERIICDWYLRRMGWEIKPEWIIKIPGVMFGISAAIRALTEKSDSIMICTPVYSFERLIKSNERRVVSSDLVLNDGRYHFNFSDIEAKILENDVKMLILCSPHNPVSRVWTGSELRQLGDICVKYGVYIVSDEIHCDFIYSGNSHVPISAVSEEISKLTVTCVAPTKTFNLAGIQSASIVISDEELRQRVEKAYAVTGYDGLNVMAISATKAAYLHGDLWLDELIRYLEESVAYLAAEFPENGKISLIKPEGTYLMWLDCHRLGLSDKELRRLFLEEAEVWLHNGNFFGDAGSGFMRMNIACPRSVLKNAVERIKSVL